MLHPHTCYQARRAGNGPGVGDQERIAAEHPTPRSVKNGERVPPGLSCTIAHAQTKAHATDQSQQASRRVLTVVNASRKFLFAAIGLTLAVSSLHASAQQRIPGMQQTGTPGVHQRIVGGSLVPSGSYPWTAALLSSSGGQFCGGSLIAPKWVVTAAHCSSSAYSVRVGSVDRTSGGQVIRVIRKINHPQYSTQNDIALLELETPVSGITPVVRGTASPAVGSTVRLLGWGQVTSPFGGDSGSRYLKQLDTPVLTRTVCSGTGAGDLCFKGTTTATACKGDSGGPALAGSVLVGATSRSGRSANYCGEDVIYTNVTYYKTWIDQYVSGSSGGGTVVHNVNLPSVSAGNWSSMYTVTIPAGTTSLVVNISGGTGDADLYVRAGAAPTTSSYSCRPYLGGNTETCTINNPTAGTTYYIGVRAYTAYSGVNMKATRSPN
jgi:hypothetical protein